MASLKIKELEKVGVNMVNPECYSWELWEANWWGWLDVPMVAFASVYMPQVEKYMIGLCDGSRVPIRPRRNTYAIMIEKDGNKFWFHMDYDSIEMYFLERELFDTVYKGRV